MIYTMLDKSQLSGTSSYSTTLSSDEVAKFDKMAKEWWDPQGKFKTALEFNRARLAWMIPQIALHQGKDQSVSQCLQGVSVLDVGSGGGLVSEALAAHGASVTGIDASAVSIEVAKRHAQESRLTIDYQHCLSSDLVKQGKQFDTVINAEVVEHVPDQPQLIKECCQLVKPGGQLLLATLNRSIRSYIIAIIGAEYVMRYLPVGTHDWRYFVKPQELIDMTSSHGVEPSASTGMKYNPFSRQWRCVADHSVNYIQSYKKANVAIPVDLN